VVLALNKPLLKTALLLLCALSLLAISLTPSSKASPESAPFDVKVVHFVDIREGGLLVINDTVTLSTAIGESLEPIQSYALGFPFSYRPNLIHVFAYERGNQSLGLGLELNTGIGKIGFYGVKVNFEPAVDISNGNSYQFTVVFVFYGSVTFSVFEIEDTTVTSYNASFPAYPSLQYDASVADVKVAIPATLDYTQSSYEKAGINLSQTTEGSKHLFSHSKSDLSAFSDTPAWLYASKTGGSVQLLDLEEFDRRIEILGNEEIAVSDTYKVLNIAGELSRINLKLPKGANSVLAYDEFGLVQEDNLATQQVDDYTNVTLTFAVPHDEKDEIHFSLHYILPWENHVTMTGFGEFNVSLPLFESPNGAIGRLTVAIVLPEGAIRSPTSISSNQEGLENAAYSTELLFAFENATPFHDSAVSLTYQRPVFWESFHPTVWMGTFVLAIGALIGAWRIYRPPATAQLPTAVTAIRADDLKAFVTDYDEKRRLLKDADSLEESARKGKIPRRQYKVRKMTIDGRLNSASRDLTVLRDKLRMAGPRYAELMRQLEVAESELQGAEAEIDRAEVRYRRGDLSPQAYHNVLETAYRRRDRAQTTIDGVLLRLREETG
jgi:hypothetical protein